MKRPVGFRVQVVTLNPKPLPQTQKQKLAGSLITINPPCLLLCRLPCSKQEGLWHDIRPLIIQPLCHFQQYGSFYYQPEQCDKPVPQFSRIHKRTMPLLVCFPSPQALPIAASSCFVSQQPSFSLCTKLHCIICTASPLQLPCCMSVLVWSSRAPKP